jgi:CRISPR/Cas system CSM-associated protein Csm3 (group 7 of RAMP superfamily)
MDISKFYNKYIIEGSLSVYSLHIGSNKAVEGFDSPTIKYLNNIAYIPGSSFRGRFQYKLKSLVNLGLTIEDRKLDISDVKKIFGHSNIGRGSDCMAGKIYIEDLIINPNTKDTIHNGTAINKHTGTTKNGNKFDYNIIENASFKLNIILENLEDYEVDMINIGLNLMKDDMFGQKTSRGIGRCKLNIDRVKYITKDTLDDYLFNGKMKIGTQEILNKGKITLKIEN